MSNIDVFLDEVLRHLRGRIPLFADSGDRRALEDAIVLLTDYRLAAMDEAGFEKLLSTLRGGRSPIGLTLLKPQSIAEERSRRWRTLPREQFAGALN